MEFRTNLDFIKTNFHTQDLPLEATLSETIFDSYKKHAHQKLQFYQHNLSILPTFLEKLFCLKAAVFKVLIDRQCNAKLHKNSRESFYLNYLVKHFSNLSWINRNESFVSLALHKAVALYFAWIVCWNWPKESCFGTLFDSFTCESSGIIF